MKRILSFICCSLLYISICYSLDIVQLNNGSVIKGVITKIDEGVSLTIKSESGREYTYRMIEVKSYNKDGELSTPIVQKSKGFRDYNYYEKGFWAAVEMDGGYLLSINNDGGYGELHFVAGYQFCEFLKVGAGFGGRYYINNKDMRCKDYKWSFPLFANVRGNIIPGLNRNVVPFYSAELGSAINDGIYFRPALGIKIGEQRGAFTIDITYTAQTLKHTPEHHSTTSFIGLKAGWEF